MLTAMEAGEFNGPAIRQELERVLSSAAFARSERLSGFLRFVVERRLEGRNSELKESLIAIEVFGRKPDYDPKLDSIVRTEAGRLRARLIEYYAGEGSSDPVVIELPKGGYTPVFRQVKARRGKLESPSGRLWSKLAVAALLVVLAAAAWWLLQRKTEPIVIAVLPLENLSHDSSNDYFGDGLTDEIIRTLSVIEGLVVRSRSSSFAFKGKPRNAREVGRQLEANYILEGSVLRSGQKLRFNVQLVRVRDDFPLWSLKFDREVTDVFAIQDEISRAIVNHLRLKLGRGRRRYETNVEAYDLYLRARALTPVWRPSDLRQAIELFEQVIAQDPAFAPAYAGLPGAYRRLAALLDIEPIEAGPKMRAAAEKAIQLDPLLGEAHDALGLACTWDLQWDQAEKSFRRAIELDPNRSTSYVDFAIPLLMVLGRFEEALRQLAIAQKTDPLSAEVQWALAHVLIAAGRYDEAADHGQRGLSLDPNYLLMRGALGRARFFQGRTEEAIRLLEEEAIRLASQRNSQIAYMYARSGRREEAEKVVAAAGAGFPNFQVFMYAGLGDKDGTFEALDRMVARKDWRVHIYLVFPELALLRGDPRLKAFRQKIGLPE